MKLLTHLLDGHCHYFWWQPCLSGQEAELPAEQLKDWLKQPKRLRFVLHDQRDSRGSQIAAVINSERHHALHRVAAYVADLINEKRVEEVHILLERKGGDVRVR